VSGVFISYRWIPDAGEARLLANRLYSEFGRDQVFLDVDQFRIGSEMLELTRWAVGQAEVLVWLVGPEWDKKHSVHGARAIDRRGDPVRVELRTALDLGLPVLPVRVIDGPLLGGDLLPGPLRRLGKVWWGEIRHGHRDADTDTVVHEIRQALPIASGRRCLARLRGIESARRTPGREVDALVERERYYLGEDVYRWETAMSRAGGDFGPERAVAQDLRRSVLEAEDVTEAPRVIARLEEFSSLRRR
jgi:hypothetical protein